MTKITIFTILAVLGILSLMALVTTGLAYLFMWIGAPKWVAWTVAIAILLIGNRSSK